MHYPCPNSHDATSTTPFFSSIAIFLKSPSPPCLPKFASDLSNSKYPTTEHRPWTHSRTTIGTRRAIMLSIPYDASALFVSTLFSDISSNFENLLPLRAPGLPRSRTLLQLLPSWALWSRRQADLWTTMRRWMWAPHHHLLSWHWGTRKVKWSEGLVWFRCWRRIPSPPPCGCRGLQACENMGFGKLVVLHTTCW